MVDVDGHQEKSFLATGDVSGKVAWGTSFQYTTSTLVKQRPLHLEIIGHSCTTIPGKMSLGSAYIDIDEAKERYRENNYEPAAYKLELDGLSRATGGVILTEIEFIAPPRNINKLRYVRVEVERVHSLAPNVLSGGTLELQLGDHEARTAFASATANTNSIPYHEVFDFAYEGGQLIWYSLPASVDSHRVSACIFTCSKPIVMGAVLSSVRTSMWANALSMFGPLSARGINVSKEICGSWMPGTRYLANCN